MSQEFKNPLPFETIREKTEQFLFPTYTKAPVAFYFGQGEYLYDTENRQYLDFMSGIAVTSLGHGEADLIEAIREQSDRIIHTSNLFYNQEQALLAEALIGHTFPGKVFLSNSGTEANEAAFKLARSFGQKEKNGAELILSLENSFHGRTTAGMCLTGQSKIHAGFGTLLKQHVYLPVNDLEVLEKQITDHGHEICALFIEPIQGEGGIHPIDKEYIQLARKLTEEHNILFVCDEIQTGMGRTGKLFAYEHYDIIPDVITLAKALGNGFPIGTMIAKEKFVKYLPPGMHGSTFGGNHLAARIAYETLKIIMGRELLDHVAALSDYIFHRLTEMKTKLPGIVEIRGVGLLIGVELDRPCAGAVARCRENGLIVNCTAQNTIRIMPPLNLSLESAAKGLDILEGCVAEP